MALVARQAMLDDWAKLFGVDYFANADAGLEGIYSRISLSKWAFAAGARKTQRGVRR